MGICAACQQVAAVAALPVLTAAAGQQTLWHPIRDADRLAAYRAAVGPLPAWWDRCVATAPAQVCPCGRSRWHGGEDEATSHLHLSGSKCALVVAAARGRSYARMCPQARVCWACRCYSLGWGCQVKCVTFLHWHPVSEQNHKLIERRFPFWNGLGPFFGHML